MKLKKQTELRYRKKISNLLNYIQRHLECDLSLDALSAVAHISKYHLHRVFTIITGESLLQYIKRTRLEFAAQRLNNTGDSITQIAIDAGYCSASAFTKSFRKHYNCTPREYRKNSTKHTINLTAISNIDRGEHLL